MFTRRRHLLAVTALACLLLASAASASPLDTFSATALPTHVKPSASVALAIALTSDPSAPSRAQKATVGIPPGFTVDPQSVTATSTAAGPCDASTWEADGELIANQRIQLRRPADDANALCPGGTLTVAFLATSAPTDGTYVWTPELLHEVEGAFTLTGAHPSVVVDGTPPTVAIAQKPSDPSNVGSAIFAFTAGESASFECKLDAGEFELCSPPRSYAGLGDGEHTFAVKATDAAGNTGPETSYAWTIDTAPPGVTLGLRPGDPSNDTTPSIAFSADEPATFECKLDAGNFEPCASPKSYDSLADGAHTFEVRPTDAAGNTGDAATYRWTVDTAAPTVAITAKPAGLTNNTSPSFAFAPSEAANVVCRLDAAAFAPCASPRSYSGLADGLHTFAVKATDLAGNAGPEASHTWTIDTAAPAAAITAKPASPTNDTSPTFAFTADGAADFLCKLDAAAFAPCASPKSYPDLPDGPHTFAVKATDAAGNTGTETSYAWTVDTSPPTPTLTTKPSDPSNTSFPSFAFTAGESGATFACKLDGAAFTTCTSPKTYTNLAETSHAFVVKATDVAGNTGPETSYTWTIDTTPPAASITGHPDNPSNERAPTFAFAADEGGSTFSCKLDAAAFAPCASPKAYTNLADGVHTFTVRATDAASNVGASVAYGWTIDTTAPIVAIMQKPSDPTKSRAASFAFSAGDAAAFECSLDHGVFATCASPKTYAELSEGSHSFSVRATDALGNAGLATSHAWTIDITPPTVAILAKPSNPSNDSSPGFVFSASETGSGFACRLEGAGFAPCSSPKDYAGLADGPHSFGVRATDAAGNTGPETNFAWTVDTVAPTTTITVKPEPLSNTKSPAFAFTASESGGTFECKLDTALFAPCSSPTAYAGLAEGPHTFVVRATDAAGNTGAQKSHAWTIDTIAPAVTIATKPGNPSNERSPTFSFAAGESAQLQCKLDGAAFAQCTSPRTYPDLADGQHTFVVKATDVAQNTGPEIAYTWTVDTDAPAATITGKPGDPSNSTAPTFAFTAIEPAAFQCKLDAGASAPCPSPKSYAGLAPGLHTFTVRATDAAGNTGAAATYVWTIDTTAPAAAITAKPSNPSNSASPTFSFTATEPGSTFVCRLDTSAPTPCASPAGYAGVGDGPHSFAVTAVDPAGNTGPETSYGWTIETRAPTALLTSAPAGLSNSSAATFAFSADEPASFDCSVDGRGFEPCSSPATHHGLGDGGHTFTVRARDAVGNLSAPVAHSWTIDTTAPETTLASAPKSGTSTSASFAFSATESGIYECRLDGAPFALCSSPKDYAGLGRGEHRFEVRAIDPAGNADATPSGHTWSVEVPVRTTSASALLAPRAGARVTRPPLLVWRPAARASYYNVQLFRGRQKLLSVWPARPRLQLRARWRFSGRERRLTPGSYRWYVWPGYGSPSTRNYGSVLGQSSFVILRSGRRR